VLHSSFENESRARCVAEHEVRFLRTCAQVRFTNFAQHAIFAGLFLKGRSGACEDARLPHDPENCSRSSVFSLVKILFEDSKPKTEDVIPGEIFDYRDIKRIMRVKRVLGIDQLIYYGQK